MDIAKSYMGKYIFPIGKALVFISGYDDDQKYYCERVTFFETSKGQVVKYAQGMEVLKVEFKYAKEFFIDDSLTEEQLLDMFINDLGIEQAKSDVFNIMHELQPDNPNISFEIGLNENQIISCIMYLKRKFPAEFQWLRKTTKSKYLQRLLNIADGFTITTTGFPE